MSRIAALLLVLTLLPLAAESIVFPPGAGVVDVTAPPYNAPRDGKTDATAAIQRAVDDHKGRNRTLWFPDGTYLVSGTVGITGGTAHSRDRFLTWQGQSERGTVIRLADRAPGFSDAAKPRIVVSVYQGAKTGDAMHGYARNLTIDTGRGNPGAVGMRFLSNNTGGIERVTIRSGDGAGAIGLDTAQAQNGPALVKHVTIQGFDRGIATGSTFSMVYEHLTLLDQRQIGFDNDGARTTIRGLRTRGAASAVSNRDKGRMFLIEAQLEGVGAAGPAISDTSGRLYLRDVQATGFAPTLRSEREGAEPVEVAGAIAEWTAGRAYGWDESAAAKGSLRLPIAETPEIPWEQDPARWIIVDAFAGEDVTAALQRAIDEGAARGATTICFPTVFDPAAPEKKNRRLVLSAPIRVHGAINRIIGMSGLVDVVDPSGTAFAEQAVFTFEDLRADAIVVERFFLLGGWDCPRHVVMFANRTGKPVVLKSVNQRGHTKKPHPGATWFLEDYSPSRQATLTVAAGEQVWARQFNPETYLAEMVAVEGGRFWCLGMKTEGRTTHVRVEKDGRAEVLGGCSYQSWKDQKLDPPLFIVRDGQASFGINLYHYNAPFTTIVEETRGGETRTLRRDGLADYDLRLYRSGD